MYTQNSNITFDKVDKIKVAVKHKRLNDLNGKEWVKATKSVWMSLNDDRSLHDIETALEVGVLLSEAPVRDNLKKNHPATFSENDIRKLIRFFTKEKEIVFDPFLGSGSSGVAALREERNFIGIELYTEWLELAKTRINIELNVTNPDIIVKTYCGDALATMRSFSSESVDFIVTSPPYWGILKKLDHKAKQERVSKKLATNYGNDCSDLGGILEYEDFVKALTRNFQEYYRLLKPKQYAAIIISDFRHGQKYYMFHAHVANAMQEVGFTLQGLISLVQDNKKLYPYGYPTTYVPNISNQFIVICRKLK